MCTCEGAVAVSCRIFRPSCITPSQRVVSVLSVAGSSRGAKARAGAHVLRCASLFVVLVIPFAQCLVNSSSIRYRWLPTWWRPHGFDTRHWPRPYIGIQFHTRFRSNEPAPPIGGVDGIRSGPVRWLARFLASQLRGHFFWFCRLLIPPEGRGHG